MGTIPQVSSHQRGKSDRLAKLIGHWSVGVDIANHLTRPSSWHMATFSSSQNVDNFSHNLLQDSCAVSELRLSTTCRATK